MGCCGACDFVCHTGANRLQSARRLLVQSRALSAPLGKPFVLCSTIEQARGCMHQPINQLVNQPTDSFWHHRCQQRSARQKLSVPQPRLILIPCQPACRLAAVLLASSRGGGRAVRRAQQQLDVRHHCESLRPRRPASMQASMTLWCIRQSSASCSQSTCTSLAILIAGTRSVQAASSCN